MNTVDTDRVRRAEVEAAANSIEAAIGDDMLLVVVNKSGTQLHIIHPDFSGARLVLRRMVVGRDVPFRTVVQQISNIYETYLKSGNLRAVLSKAFDVEEVTDKFFKKYHEIFDDALKSITGFGGDDDDAKRLFVQTLFNRLMFVHFLSRKGWLSINDDKDYLRALWIDYRNTSAPSPTGIAPNFYRDRLRLLFFTGLNNPDSRDLSRGASPLIGSVPFLNGGLFTEGEHDAEDSPIVVPDSVIEQALEELFEKFNFTVMESTPFDIEVAVDPEMLGKVFEELVNERHDSGAYYTPRPVVAFMCREALKGYLEGKDTGVSADAIAAFIDSHDANHIGGTAAPRVGAELDTITVVDPACGSGAFLLGMMQELVELRTALFRIESKPEDFHALKLHIIERNLYGVDIDEFAVNIAMLRLWLSLAIDFDGDTPPALPNLDFKIVRGDSLLGPDPSPDKYPDLFRYQVVQAADRIAKLKAEFMNTSDRFLKAERQDEIEAVERELTAALSESPAPEGAVDWRVQFAEVFALRGGFDVAIANPPYVESRNSRLKEDAKIAYGLVVADDWGASLQKGSDLLIYFFARSAKLIAPSGSAVFIAQNGWLSANYGKSFQDFTRGRFAFRRVVDTTSRFFSQSRGPSINAVISVLDRSTSNQIEHQMVDADLTALSSRMVNARDDLKWGPLFAMPDWFRSILADLTKSEDRADKLILEFGQGINVPKRLHNVAGATIGMVVDTPPFACAEADAHVRRSDVSDSRLSRVPALLMPRGIGNRYYASLNQCKAFSFSGVDMYLPDKLWESDMHYCLWVYMNSSFAWLYREFTGRANLGGGMLKAEATDMKTFPVHFDFDFGVEAREVFDLAAAKSPLPVAQELGTDHHIRIDEIVGKYFGFSDQLDDLRSLLIERVEFRYARASGGK